MRKEGSLLLVCVWLCAGIIPPPPFALQAFDANASPGVLPPPAHDSGSGWLATPFLYDSFIRNSMPVYPGAFGSPRWGHDWRATEVSKSVGGKHFRGPGPVAAQLLPPPAQGRWKAEHDRARGPVATQLLPPPARGRWKAEHNRTRSSVAAQLLPPPAQGRWKAEKAEPGQLSSP